jgi:photosystem II stability/assembly factor-like uncharacterized protein
MRPNTQHTFLRCTFLIFMFISCHLLRAQQWIEMMDAGVDFYTIRDSFNQLWDNVPYERGKGYKQFKRWEWFMEQRVYPTGEYFNPMAAWAEFEKFLKTQDENHEKNNGNWTSLGPSNWIDGAGWNAGNGRINVVVQDPVNANTIYVGAASGGLWRSTNGGTSWTNLTDNQAVLGVSGIAIDPTNPNIIYIGTGDGDGSDTYSIGVLKSTDGGATWNTTGLNWTVTQSRVIRKILMHPTDPLTLFAATSNGTYRTTNGGTSWTQVQSGISVQDVEFKPGDPSIVYTCTDQFYRSTNGGASFTLVTTGLPTAANINRFKIAVSPHQPDWVYVVGGKQSNSTFEGIYRSTDSGQSFTVGTNTPNMFGYATNGGDTSGQSWYDMAITVNPANANEVYIAGINVWKSTDGGTNFTIMTQWQFPNSIGYVHADVHDLAFYGNNLYCGSDGGVFISTNLGEDWTNLTNGITIMQFYDIAVTPQNANLVLGGSQDNGTNRYNGSTTWTHVIGADGMNAIIDPTNQNILYGAIQNGDIRKSTNGGSSFFQIIDPTDFAGESGNWVTPYALDPNTPATIYVGYEEIYKSVNGGTSWTVLGSVGNATTTRNLEIAPSNTSTIYITKGSLIYKTTNGGTSWTSVSTGLPNLTITDIAIDPANANRLWITMSGFTAGSKVYQSVNGGTSWTNISGNLPNLPANCIAIRPNTNDILYAGMDVAIYTKDATQTNWTLCNTGLPNVIVEEIEINNAVNKIYIGSYGRGAWVMDLPTTPLCTSLTNPANGATNVPVTTSLTWAASSGNPTGYRLNVGTTPGGTNILNNFDVGNVTTYDPPGDFPYGTTIYVKVMPYNAVGSSTGCVETSFSTQIAPPACTNLTNPLNGATNVDIATALNWAPANGSPTGYRLTVGTLSGGSDILNNFDVGNVSSYDPPGVFPYGSTIYVKIIPYNGTGSATGCSEESFSTQIAPPACTNLTNPLNGATNVDIATALNWAPANGSPTGYRLTVGTLSGGSDILNNFDVGNVSSYDPPGVFPYGSTIYVKIIPYNGTGSATGCSEESFSTQIAPPACTNLTNPLNGATNVDIATALNWTPANGSPTGYRLTVGTLSGGSDILNNFDVGNVSSYDPPGVFPYDSTIYVKIIPYNNTGDAAGCAEESFMTEVGVPTCSNLTSPSGGSTNVPVNTNLHWTAAAGNPDGYFLSLGTTPGGTDILNFFDLGNVTTYDPLVDFPYGSVIYVNITPYNANGNAVGCAEANFTTEFLAPPFCTSLTSPTAGSTGVPVTTALSWSAANGNPAGYKLFVGTTPGGAEILNNFDVGNVTTYDPPGIFSYGSTVYVKIIPYNAGGNALGCIQQSFTTTVCVPNLTIMNNPALIGNHFSTGTLTAFNVTILSGSTVNFYSDSDISLEQDFTVEQGAVFEATIQACPD